MTTNLILVGSGPFARELLEWVLEGGLPADTTLKGYLDVGAPDDQLTLDLPHMGNGWDYQPRENDIFLCALLEPREKFAICRGIKERGGVFRGFPFFLSGHARRNLIGAGCILSPKIELTTDVVLDELVTVRSFTSIGHDVKVGAGCTISTHCDIAGYVRIGEGALLQPNVVVLPHLQVGDNARVGAGSVVVRHVAAGTSVWGVPAKKVDFFLAAV